MTEIDGGKICAGCKGKCCVGCFHWVGHFVTGDVPEIDFKEDKKILTTVGIKSEVIREYKTLRSLKRPNKKEKEKLKEFCQLFSERLGEFTLEKGFLGIDGCTIPREKRSQICNSYYCNKLTGMLKNTTNFRRGDVIELVYPGEHPTGIRYKVSAVCPENNLDSDRVDICLETDTDSFNHRKGVGMPVKYLRLIEA